MRKIGYGEILINRGRINNNCPNPLDSPILVSPHAMDNLPSDPLHLSPSAIPIRPLFHPCDTIGHSRGICRWIHQREHSLARTRHRGRWGNMGQSNTLSNLYIRRRIHRPIPQLARRLEGIYPRDIEGWSRDIRLDGYMVRFLAFDNSHNPHFTRNCFYRTDRFLGEGRYLLDELEGEWDGG